MATLKLIENKTVHYQKAMLEIQAALCLERTGGSIKF
jgi:hypothetical protein